MTLQVLLTSLFVLHEPTRTYLDPLTGRLFDDGGVERDIAQRPHNADKYGPGGSVIMPKLGNETAKWVLCNDTSYMDANCTGVKASSRACNLETHVITARCMIFLH